jgi:ketopantoate reductase
MDESIKMTIEIARSRGVGLRKMWEEVIAVLVEVKWRLRMWVEVKELKQQENESIMKFVLRLK